MGMFFNYQIQFMDGQNAIVHFGHNKNAVISSDNRSIKINKGDRLTVALIGVENMDINDNSIKFENADNVALISIENLNNHEWVTLDVGVKGNKENLDLLKSAIQKEVDGITNKAFDVKITTPAPNDSDSTKDSLIKVAMILVGVLSVWGIAQAFHPNKEVNTAINSATPTAEKLINHNPLEGSNIEKTNLLPSENHAPQPINSVQDMTPENLQAYNGHITDEVRRQVLEQMGINMDELESLNDCAVE